MGGSESKHGEIALVSQVEGICATEARFCLPHPVHLRLREKYFSFSGDDFKVSDPNTGVVYFQCEGKAFSLREKKVLLDNVGHPICNLKEALFTLSDRFTLYAGNDSDKQICKIQTQLNFLKAKVSVAFADAVTGAQRYIVLKGDWRSKSCVIFWGEPKSGGIPIAKVYRPTVGRSLLLDKQDYYLEVVPGVDIALMVMLCIALDEHAKDN